MEKSDSEKIRLPIVECRRNLLPVFLTGQSLLELVFETPEMRRVVRNVIRRNLRNMALLTGVEVNNDLLVLTPSEAISSRLVRPIRTGVVSAFIPAVCGRAEGT